MLRESALLTICNCVREIYQSGGKYRRFEVISANITNDAAYPGSTCWSITLKDVTTDELPPEADMELLNDLTNALANRYSIGYHFRIIYYNVNTNRKEKEYELGLVTYEDNSEESNYKGFNYTESTEQSE